MMLRYRENMKHKRGASGRAPIQWYPTPASICPGDVTIEVAQALLRDSIEGRDKAHPDQHARYALDGQGRFYKGYSEDGGTTWHGYPVHESLVRTQVPSRVLKHFVQVGRLTKARYNKLHGSAQ